MAAANCFAQFHLVAVHHQGAGFAPRQALLGPLGAGAGFLVVGVETPAASASRSWVQPSTVANVPGRSAGGCGSRTYE